jgi:hypothetical protein
MKTSLVSGCAAATLAAAVSILYVPPVAHEHLARSSSEGTPRLGKAERVRRARTRFYVGLNMDLVRAHRGEHHMILLPYIAWIPPWCFAKRQLLAFLTDPP